MIGFCAAAEVWFCCVCVFCVWFVEIWVCKGWEGICEVPVVLFSEPARCVPIISSSLFSGASWIMIVRLVWIEFFSTYEVSVPSTRTMKLSSLPSFFVASISSLGSVSSNVATGLVAWIEKINPWSSLFGWTPRTWTYFAS